MNLKICPICRSIYPEDFIKCDCCNEELVYNDSYKKWDDTKKYEYMAKYKPKYVSKPSTATIKRSSLPIQHKLETTQQANKPKCPTCQSTDVQKLSTMSKVLGVGLLGLASKTVGKTYKCNKCGYYW